jgi:hypothetical protein
MLFEEFLEKVEPILGKWTVERGEIRIEWTVGGVTGGSCWGTEHIPRNAEPEPEFKDLDKILEQLCPDISFLQYKRLCREVIEIGEDTRNDYYGNYRDEAYKKVSLCRLWRVLSEQDLV